MKTSMIAAAVLLAACCSTPPAPTPQPAAETAPAAPAPPAAINTRPSGGKAILIPAAPPTYRTKTVLHELINGRPENVVSDFNPQMKASLPADKLTAMWKDLESKYGAYQSMGEPTLSEEEGLKVVYAPLTFANGTVRAKVAYDQTNYIAAFSFVP